MCEILFVIQLEPVRQVLPFDWFTTDHLVSGESTLHWVTLFSARSRIFLPIAQSYAALFCCRLAIRASSLRWLVGNKASFNLKLEIHHVINPKRQTRVITTIRVLTSRTHSNVSLSLSETCSGRSHARGGELT